jgi:hypothetical protein
MFAQTRFMPTQNVRERRLEPIEIPVRAFPFQRKRGNSPALVLPQFRTENRYALFLELLQISSVQTSRLLHLLC